MFARARVARRLQRGRAASSSGDTATARDHYEAALRAATRGDVAGSGPGGVVVGESRAGRR